MPGFSDLDLVDLDIKPDMMDTNILLNTFSSDEMDLWNNFINDDNTTTHNNNNNNNRETIKEENIDIEFDCFSTICPNDLLASLQTNDNYIQHQHQQQESHQQNEYDDIISQQEQQQQQQQQEQQYNLINDFNNFHSVLGSASTSSGRSSLISSRSTSVDTRINDLLDVDLTTTIHNYQKNKAIIITTEATGSSSTTNKKTNVLPPSPPSSFNSDSDSNHSPSIKLQNSTTNTNSLRGSSSVIKKIRHQPYSVNSKSLNGTNSISSSSSKSSLLNNQDKHNKIQTQLSDDDCWPFLCSLSKLPSSGPLLLTEEEKRTLRQENLSIPTQLPLSKSEEKILKKIRRKIKNKISAQESRRKKKEYVDALEKRVDNYLNENLELKKRLEDLELNNKNLLTQLNKLQNTLSQQSQQSQQTITNVVPNITQQKETTNQLGTILMVLVLFFAVVLGLWSPMLSAKSATTTKTDQSTAASNSNAKTAATTVESTTANEEIHTFNSYLKTNNVIMTVDEHRQQQSQLKHYDNNIQLSDANNESINSNFTSSGRSKSGNAVELTKVRPFARKIPIYNPTNNKIQLQQQQSIDLNNQKQQQSEYLIVNNSNDEAQIIILNLAGQQQQQQQQQLQTTNTATNHELTTSSNRILNSAKLVPSKQYRVLNGSHSIIKLNSSTA